MCSKEESTDIARIVLVSGLPTEWLTIPKEMYTVSICKWFEKNFGLSDDTIENVYCCPLTDPTNQVLLTSILFSIFLCKIPLSMKI